MKISVFDVLAMESGKKLYLSYIVDQAKYETLRARLEEAKLKNTNPAGATDEAVLKQQSEGDECFANFEWYEASKIYQDLLKRKIRLRPIVAKTALCLALRNAFDQAFRFAETALRSTPAESSAYAALAVIKARIGSFSEATLSLNLAELGLRSNSAHIEYIRQEIETLESLQRHQIASFRFKLEQNPNFLEVAETKEWRDICVSRGYDYEDVITSLKRLKEDPTNLELDLTANQSIWSLVLRHWLYPFDPLQVFPMICNDVLASNYAQLSCPAHTLSSSLFLNVLRYLSLSDVSALMLTCRFYEYLGHFPAVINEISKSSGIVVDPSTKWGEPVLQFPTGIYDLQKMRNFLQLMSLPAKEEMHMGLTNSFRKSFLHQLRSLSLKHRIICESEWNATSTSNHWLHVAELLSQSPDQSLAQKLIDDPILWSALEGGLRFKAVGSYYDDCIGLLSAYLCLVVLGKPKARIPSLLHHFLALLASSIKLFSYAAIAVHHTWRRLVEMDLIVICASFDTTASAKSNRLAAYFTLNGIWQGTQVYDNPLLRACTSEECIMNLNFPSVVVGNSIMTGDVPFEMIGEGLDSVGAFYLENPVIDLKQKKIAFTKVYRTRKDPSQGPLKHKYQGIIYPCGISGSYGLNDDYEIGCFFYGRPRACADAHSCHSPSFASTKPIPTASWDQLVEVVKQKKTKNEEKRKELFEEYGVPSPSDHLEIYEAEYDLARRDALVDMWHALQFTSFAEAQPTPNLILQSIVQDYDLDDRPYDEERTMERPLEDTDEKWKMRKRVHCFGRGLYDAAFNRMVEANIHLLVPIAITLENHNFDISSPAVIAAIDSFASFTAQSPIMEQNFAVKLHRKTLKKIEVVDILPAKILNDDNDPCFNRSQGSS